MDAFMHAMHFSQHSNDYTPTVLNVVAQAELVAHPLSLDCIEIADFTLGDLHGGSEEMGVPVMEALNSNSISVGGLSLSLHGLSTRCGPGLRHRTGPCGLQAGHRAS